MIFNKSWKNNSKYIHLVSKFYFAKFSKNTSKKILSDIVENNPHSLLTNIIENKNKLKIKTSADFKLQLDKIDKKPIFDIKKHYIDYVDFKKNSAMDFMRKKFEEHYSLKTKLELNVGGINKEIGMYNILTTKSLYKDKNNIPWETDKLTEQQLIPKEFIKWYEENADELQRVFLLDKNEHKQYKKILIEKLENIYSESINKNTGIINQYISGNHLIDLNNNILQQDLSNHKEIAINFYIEQNREELLKKSEEKISIFNKIFNNNLEEISNDICINILENKEVIRSIILIISKGEIDIQLFY